MQQTAADEALLRRFQAEVKEKVPHLKDGTRNRVLNPTPLVNLTDALIECARTQYGMRLRTDAVKVYGKFDSKIYGGSVKVRPAVRIIEDAIVSGRLARGQTVFEATSGNFGLALGMLRNLGLDAVALVSRKLQQGVVKQLRADGVRLINLDIDICPAPGMQGDANLFMARGIAASVGQQLAELGFDSRRFDAVASEAEELLARQDAIGLAKLLARAYVGFCPEQYDNELNAEVHETVTAPELDQQLGELGDNLGGHAVVCAFGTGGTATGVSRYVSRKYGRKGVRVVFPLAGQDVAGIRTREKAEGLKFYQPEAYLGEHEVDFEETRKVFEFFNGKGYDVGESGALVLYACMQMLNYGLEKKLVAVVADGGAKYVTEVRTAPQRARRDQVTLSEAASSIREYGGVVWAHNMFVPREEGIRVIASALGCDKEAIKVARAKDVQTILNGGEPSEDFEKFLPQDQKPLLLVCMAGNTSLMLAKVLERRGIVAESLVGGITGLPASRTRQPFELVQISAG
jgi:cysteine synthase/rhodanese-related sulfurtransferase